MSLKYKETASVDEVNKLIKRGYLLLKVGNKNGKIIFFMIKS